jgi:hypothetical protein
MNKITQKDLILNVIGKEENIASSWIRQSGCDVCVYHKDGVNYFKTADLNFNRVNLKIEKGIVIDAYIG